MRTPALIAAPARLLAPVLAFAIAQPALAGGAATPPAAIARPAIEPGLAEMRAGFAGWMEANHVPGLVWGVVADGRLVHVEGMGVQDLRRKRPVTPDTAFRIASMSKAFTAYAILKLQQAGRLRLDDPASLHVPEMAGWAHGISVGDLMHHTAGFVTDDPWGDRQQPMAEADFTAMLKTGVPFHSAPGTRYEYSNFGYATLGRIITNVSGMPYQAHVRDTIWKPLGMLSTRYEVGEVPPERLALGYRWQEGRWLPEPEMADGVFGAMGGVVTTANDYAKWMTHLLSGWPAEAAATDAQSAVNRAVIRQMREGGGFVHQRARPGKDAPDCRMMMIYAAGLVAGTDCELGGVLFHSGGYPGYGSHMLLLPDAGVGLFAFSNRTYAAPLPPVWDAAGILKRAGFATDRPIPESPAVSTAMAAVRHIWESGRIDARPDALAMNMLMDRPADLWAKDLQQLKAKLGRCDLAAPVMPEGALSARFSWACEKGRLNGRIILAPTAPATIQALRLAIEQGS